MVVSRTPLDARLGELRIRELMGESIYRIGKGGRHSRSACALRPFDCRLFASLLYVMHIPNATVRVSPRVYLSYSHYTYLDGRSREDGYVNISLERTFLSGSIHHVQFDITSSEQHHPSSVVRPTVANFEKMEYSKARERQREREKENSASNGNEVYEVAKASSEYVELAWNRFKKQKPQLLSKRQHKI